MFVEIQSPLIIGSNFFLSSEGDYFITVVQVMRNITSNNFGRDLVKASDDFIISVSPVFVCVSVERQREAKHNVSQPVRLIYHPNAVM